MQKAKCDGPTDWLSDRLIDIAGYRVACTRFENFANSQGHLTLSCLIVLPPLRVKYTLSVEPLFMIFFSWLMIQQSNHYSNWSLQIRKYWQPSLSNQIIKSTEGPTRLFDASLAMHCIKPCIICAKSILATLGVGCKLFCVVFTPEARRNSDIINVPTSHEQEKENTEKRTKIDDEKWLFLLWKQRK